MEPKSEAIPAYSPVDSRIHTAIGAAVGFAFAAIGLTWPFLLGLGVRWEHPRPDLVAYLTSALYFLREPWHMPLFTLSNMGYPEGGSVIYNDGIPLAAFIAKIIKTVTGFYVNHFGPWFLVSYILQGALAARVAYEIGNRSRITAALFGVLALSMPIFYIRIEHVALAGQFVLLWGLLCYFRTTRRKLSVWSIVALSTCALLINAYLFAMVVLLLAAALAQAWQGGQRREALTAVLACAAALLVVATLGGFLRSDLPVGMLSTGGFGHYSWNLITLVLGPPGYWSWGLGPIVRDATGGQYEGDAYLGAGVLLLFAMSLVLSRAEVRAAIRRHVPLVLAIALCAAFAASDRVYISSHLVAEYHLIPNQDKLAGLFRVSGRFVWPLVYLLTLAPALLVMRRLPQSVFAALLICCTALQVVEGWPIRRQVRAYTESAEPDLIGVPEMALWMSAHRRVWQFPSWFCGGLGRDKRGEGIRRETQLQVLAAKLGLANNSVYMGRPLKDCARERHEAEALLLSPGTLYIFDNTEVLKIPRLAALVATPACRSVGWGFVCSASWSDTAAPRAVRDAADRAISPTEALANDRKR